MQTSLRAYFSPALALGLGGWAFTLWLVRNVPPWPWARWLFFAGIFAGTFGLSFLFFLLWQTWRESPQPAQIASRRATLTALYLSLYFWLEQGISVSRPLAFGMALALVGLEAVFSRRDPAPAGAPPPEQMAAAKAATSSTETEADDDFTLPA